MESMAQYFNCSSKVRTKILKTIIYVLLGVVIFILCIKSILKYNEWPVYTETNVVSQNEVRFPVMTFCPLKNGYKEDILKVIDILLLNKYFRNQIVVIIGLEYVNKNSTFYICRKMGFRLLMITTTNIIYLGLAMTHMSAVKNCFLLQLSHSMKLLNHCTFEQFQKIKKSFILESFPKMDTKMLPTKWVVHL